MPVDKGDFILVNYIVKVLDGEEKVIDTTLEEVARESGIYRENSVYGPELVIVGENFLLSAVEETIIGMNEGEEKEIVLEPKDAFGERDPNNIKVYSARIFSQRGVIPRVGEEIEVEGRRGRIIRVGGGRVTVDFNHPYAGRKVSFKVKVEKILKREEEKISELFHRWFRTISREDINVKIDRNTAKIGVPLTIFNVEGAYILINGFSRDITKYIKDIDEIKIEETITIERPKREDVVAESSGEDLDAGKTKTTENSEGAEATQPQQ